MFKNYFKIAWRNLIGNKVFSLINIIGLAIGITSCILIFLFIQNELGYDKHWAAANRIVKINQHESRNGVTDQYGVTSFLLAQSLKEELPEIEQITRAYLQNNYNVSYKEKHFIEDNQYFVDANFLEVFDFDLLKGDPKTCLKEPNTVVISQAVADKFFGNEDPMGKLLKYSKKSYKVTGVLKNTGLESHFKPNALISLNSWSKKKLDAYSNWFQLGIYTYAKLKNNNLVNTFDRKLSQWKHKKLDPLIKEAGLDYTVEVKSQKITDIHFDKTSLFNFFEKGEKNYVVVFGWVAVFLLLIACFNYMNLSTSRVLKRSKEVGLRKVVGASRAQLIFQFLSESFILSFISLIISLFLLVALLPAFNSVTGKEMHLNSILLNYAFWIALVLIIIFISLIGGSYPAFYLSQFQPVKVFKGNFSSSIYSSLLNKIKLRQVLVVLQFTISIIIIIATIIAYMQLKLMKNKDLGFNSEQVVVLRLPAYIDSTEFARFLPMKNDLLANPSIKCSATTNQIIGEAGRIDFLVKDNGKIIQTPLNTSSGDYDYLKTLNIKLTLGRYYSKELATDEENFVVNEATVKLLKWKDPLKMELSSNGQTFGKVIGVVKDYNYRSPHSPVEPMAILLPNDYPGNIGEVLLLKIAPTNIPETIAFIEQKWKAFFPNHPFIFSFLDEKYNEQYAKDNIMLKLFNLFSFLTILISCLGLFGLATYTIERRTKEIGIRKVIGASVSSINFIISKDFLVLVFIAIIVASPIAYYALNKWLQTFAYKTEIYIWVFVLSGAAAFTIATLTISFQTIKAALANPIKSLRTE